VDPSQYGVIRPSRCRFIVDDALVFVGKAASKGRSYGLTILDPPTFGRSASGWSTARRESWRIPCRSDVPVRIIDVLETAMDETA
jgi:hypothetical protein